MPTSPSDTWQALLPALTRLYEARSLSHRLEQELPYHRRAFEHVQALWQAQLQKVDKLRVVMLAESPLYGNKESYFYNPAAGATEFFTYLDGEALVGPLPYSSNLRAGIRPRKQEMLRALAQAGFLILDLFPFALKSGNTSISYPQLRGTDLYDRLFLDCLADYLVPKLSLLGAKFTPHTTFVFRYLFLREQFERSMLCVLRESGFVSPIGSITSVHNGKSVDRDKLGDIWQRAASNA